MDELAKALYIASFLPGLGGVPSSWGELPPVEQDPFYRMAQAAADYWGVVVQVLQEKITLRDGLIGTLSSLTLQDQVARGDARINKKYGVGEDGL